MENARSGKETAEDLFYRFMDAEDCPGITHSFRRLVQVLGIKSDRPREFYSLLKGKLQSWRCKSLWELLDSRANQKEYGKGKLCEDTQVLIIGAGPIGLRTAIEVALLGAQVVIVEKRESFTRNNVLHLWPFLLTDFRSLGAKKFYGKFCSGSIDHISIRRLQAVLLKTALIFGAKLHTGVTFEDVVEPNSPEDCWRCKVSPKSHPVSEYEFDVLIGADGKKNVIPGFQQIEMRGTLAIGITANFVNHGTEAEANVEEISGIAYQFNPQFFDDLLEQKGIKLENIVYYKDETHYFVMTAGKASLLKRGALKQDLYPSWKLLAPDNIDHSKLLEYVTDVVKYATKGTLKNFELKLLANKQPDIAAFDFTSIKKAEHAARIVERKGSKLLVGLVGDSLLEPFWPTGSGCARGVLSALDAAWMIRSFAQDKPPLQILSERENIYRLLSGTNAENLHKNHATYTINPNTRYLHITHKKIREVYHLYDTDDPVNADFSLGSPQADFTNKASRKRRVSTGAKSTAVKGYRRGRADSHLAAEFGRIRSTSGSSVENALSHKPLSATKSEPLDGRNRLQPLGSTGSDDEVFKTKGKRVTKVKSKGSPLTGRRARRSTEGSSGDELKDKQKRRTVRKRTFSKESVESPKEKTHRKRGFFGFGKAKQKRKAGEGRAISDKGTKSMKWKPQESVENLEHNPQNGVTLSAVHKKGENLLRIGEKRQTFRSEDSPGIFSRDHYTRRSAREIIREMEARSRGESLENAASTGEGGITNPKTKNAENPDERVKRETKDEEEKNRKNKENKKSDEKKIIKKEDEKTKMKNKEKKKKEEDKRKKEGEKKRQEQEKKKKEEEEKRKKREEEEEKKQEQNQHLQNKRGTQVKSANTPPSKRTKKRGLLDEIVEISPSAKRAIPVLSKLSPDINKETQGGVENCITSAVRDAAMVLLATPLLIDSLTSTGGKNRAESMLLKESGRVRDVVNRYNTLSDLAPFANKMNGFVTPLRRPRDRVDGPGEKPQRLDKICNENEDNDGSEKDAKSTTADMSDSPAEQRKGLVLRRSSRELSTSPSMQRLMSKLQDFNDGTPLADQDAAPKIAQVTTVGVSMETNESKQNKQEDTADTEEVTAECVISRGEPVIKDFTSAIWQKTAIAVVTEKSQENKENEADTLNSSVKKDEDKEKQFPKRSNSQNRRRLSAAPSETMSEKLQNLLDSTTPSRAVESIKYMIGVCKQIQKHPNEEKYYRIFKGRVKFRKHVGTIRNAKLFMVSSGWTEIGSFFVFPLSKRIEEPLLILNKYLSIAEGEGKKEKTTETRQRAKLQRAGSSDLAERILELKDALVSARIKNKARKSISEGISENQRSLLFKRTKSLDEMRLSRRKSAVGSDSKKDSGLGKVDSASRKDTKDEGGNLCRSSSENPADNSSDICGVSSPNFSPFKRTFSQRSTQDDGDLDLVMENPLGIMAAADEDLDRASSKDVEESDHLKTSPTAGEGRVLSPRDAVLEEADQLSTVLENLIESLGSFDSTDEEEQTGVRKAEGQTVQGGKVEKEKAIQLKNIEFEELCETLSLLIAEGTSDSSENTNDTSNTNDTGSTLSEKEPNVDRELRSRDGSFKVPLRSTRKGTEQLKKAKSLDGSTTSLRRSRKNNGVNRERLPKASSIDVSTGSNRSEIWENKGEMGLHKSTSNGFRRNSSGQRSGPTMRSQRDGTDHTLTMGRDRPRAYNGTGPTTRSQRQMADRCQSLESSRVSQSKLVNNNKRDLGKDVNGRQMKRVASKANSVDLDRKKERPLTARSKSEELAKESDEGSRLKSSRRSQNNRRSATSSSSDEDAKKKQGTKNSKGTTRKQPRNLRSSKERPRLSPKGNFETRPGKLTAVKKKGKVEHSNSDTEKNSTKSSAVVNRTRGQNVEEENLGENNGSLVFEFHGFTESEQTIMPEKNSSDNDSGIHTKEEEVSDHIAIDNDTTKNASKPVEETDDVEIAKNAQYKNTVLADAELNAKVTVEYRNETEIVKLSKEIQSFYSSESVERDQKESDVQDVMEEMPSSPNDFERRDLVEEAEKSSGLKKEEAEEGTDGLRPKAVAQDQENSEEQSSSASNHSATVALANSRENNKKMLSDIGRQRSRGSRKETVPLTLEERKQRILEASMVKPTSKPTDKRRSILQIKSRNDGNLVKNAKVAFGENSPATQPTAESTGPKSSKQHHFRFRGRKKKSFESARVPLDVVTEAQEETRDEAPITNGHVQSDQSHNTPLRNEVSLAEAEARSSEQEGEKGLKGKRLTPVRLSPFRLPFTKRTGSYDLGSNSAGTVEESPEHFISKHE